MTPDLELRRSGTGYKFVAGTQAGLVFLAAFKDEYETAELALYALGKALKRALRVAINLPLSHASDGEAQQHKEEVTR